MKARESGGCIFRRKGQKGRWTETVLELVLHDFVVPRLRMSSAQHQASTLTEGPLKAGTELN